MDQLLLWSYTFILMASYSYNLLNERSIASNLQTPKQSHFPPLLFPSKHNLDHIMGFSCPQSASNIVGVPRQLLKWLCLEGHCFTTGIQLQAWKDEVAQPLKCDISALAQAHPCKAFQSAPVVPLPLPLAFLEELSGQHLVREMKSVAAVWGLSGWDKKKSVALLSPWLETIQSD